MRRPVNAGAFKERGRSVRKGLCKCRVRSVSLIVESNRKVHRQLFVKSVLASVCCGVPSKCGLRESLCPEGPECWDEVQL